MHFKKLLEKCLSIINKNLNYEMLKRTELEEIKQEIITMLEEAEFETIIEGEE